MNDAKPTCGWNEAKPHGHFSMDERSRTYLGFNAVVKSIEGTEQITAEWLIEKWGFRKVDSYDDELASEIPQTITKISVRRFVFYNEGKFSIHDIKLADAPKTRDEFRQFAKWFGLEEKK